MKNYLRYQFPWQFTMLAIFIQSGIEKISIPDIGIDWFDKILHFMAFGILAVLVLRGMIHIKYVYVSKYAVWIAGFITILFGASDEIHQYFVPGRHASYGDWIADTLGTIVFILLYVRWRVNQNTGKRANTGR